ncbi:hypothetical protein EDC04DRAFT_703521 [Pisolithus marmoratus]|nr:hypothetical protein EDC04DRAFT_703521 [Pisolithus marmoratus]
MNVETIPLLYRTALQPGRRNNHEGTDGSCQVSGKMAPLSSSNKLRHQVRLCAVGKPTLPVLPTHDVDSPQTSAFLATGAQNTPNYYNISEPSYPSAGPDIPTWIISSMIPDKANPLSSFHGYLGLPNDSVGAVVASGSSNTTLATASFPPETSDAYPPALLYKPRNPGASRSSVTVLR